MLEYQTIERELREIRMKNSRGEHKSDLDSVKANSRKPYRHWDEPTVVEEIKKFIEDHGEFPTRKSLLEHGHGDLVSIIDRGLVGVECVIALVTNHSVDRRDTGKVSPKLRRNYL